MKQLLEIKPGVDVTEVLGVIKYIPQIPACLSGTALGGFPSHSIKTDEERIHNLIDVYEEYKQYTWIATEKLDGSSDTYFVYEDKFGVSSRNLTLKENDKNSFWKFARDNDVEEKMRDYMEACKLDALTLQGELIGNGIQKNKYKLDGLDVRFFRMFDPTKYEFFDYPTFIEDIKKMGLKTVPIICESMKLPDTVEECIAFADGRSQLYDTAREGVVFVALDAPIDRYQGRLSFKALSNKFILKHNE